MASIQLPRPRITKEQWDKFTKDPEVVTLEIFFVFLTLSNIFVLYRILLDVCPFPVTLTWFQLLSGLSFAVILGESSREFPQCALFPPFTLDLKLYEQLAVPILIYLGMITMSNVLLHVLPGAAAFPVVVSLAVVLHHTSRFIGCGQVYLPFRWMSLAVMLFGFLLSLFDRATMGIAVFPAALLYAVCSAVYRGWCLEKAMHAVEGRGNTLHNHQAVMGLLFLPFIAAITGEWKIFQWMPSDFSSLFTWQCWGCLVSAGTLPFLKNVVANRMIRRTGQAPWRLMEAISMVLVFLIGAFFFDSVSAVGTLAFVVVLTGRVLGMLDVLSKDPEDRRRAIREEPSHAAAQPSYEPLGSSKKSFEAEADQAQEPPRKASFETEAAQSAVRPFLVPIEEGDE